MIGGDNINLNIKSIRERNGVSKAELCRRAGITRQTLYKAEEGGNVTMETLDVIAKALKCKVRDFF